MLNSCLTKQDLETSNLSHMDEERRNKVLAIKDKLSLSYEDTLNFGSEASEKLTEFSSEILKNIKMKDVPEIEETITGLLSNLEKVNADTLMTKKPSFFARLLHIDSTSAITDQFKDVASLIDSASETLERANMGLKKDIITCEQYLKKNVEYINELDNYIVAGQLRVEEEKKAIEEDKKTIDTTDMIAVHALIDRQGDVDRMERKLHNLLLMRGIAVQNIPQIMLIRDGNGALIEKIDTSINSVIPMWKSQMSITINIMRQRNAQKIQQTITDTTNKLIEKNSELLKESSIEIAKDANNGIVDVAVLKASSNNLIETLKSVQSIRESGRIEREKATKDLLALQTQLNNQMLQISADSQKEMIGA